MATNAVTGEFVYLARRDKEHLILMTTLSLFSFSFCSHPDASAGPFSNSLLSVLKSPTQSEVFGSMETSSLHQGVLLPSLTLKRLY